MPTVGLLRTNPKLTSNVKIVIDTDENLYLDTISLTDSYTSRFSAIKINPNNFFSYDLYKFFDKGNTPNSVIFETQRVASDLIVVSDFQYQYEQQYNYGAEKCDTSYYKGSNRIFAPLFVDSNLPKYFVIFKMDGAKTKTEINPVLVKDVRYKVFGTTGFVSYDNKKLLPESEFIASSNGGNYVISGNTYVTVFDEEYEYKQSISFGKIKKDFISNSDIVTVFSMSELDSNIGKYLSKHISDKNFTSTPLYVDMESRELTYTGINIKNGVVSSISEDASDLFSNPRTIIDFDKYVTRGFERNGLIVPNIFNLEWVFDDPESEGKFNRYFGLYVDDIDFGEFTFDLNLLKRNAKYYNPYFNNFEENLPLFYRTMVEDSGGIEMAIDSITSGFIPLNISEKDSFFYVKNKHDKFYKINNGCCQDSIRLVKKKIDISEFTGFDGNVINQKASLSKDKGIACATLKVDNTIINTGYKISLLYRNVYKGHIYGDHLPTLSGFKYGEGTNHSFYFYPYGNDINIAKGIAKAFNSRFKGKMHVAAKESVNEVLFYSTLPGISGNDYSLLVEDRVNSQSFVIKFGGGSESYKNRVIINYDYNKNITNESRIVTDKGFTKVADISTSFEDSDNSKTITSVLSDVEIKVSNGYVDIHNPAINKFGVFHIYDLVDFDFDFFESSYNKSYDNEYNKYYHITSLKQNRKYRLFGGNNVEAVIEYKGRNYSSIDNIVYLEPHWFTYRLDPTYFEIYIAGIRYILDPNNHEWYNPITSETYSNGEMIVLMQSNMDSSSTPPDIEWSIKDIVTGQEYDFNFSYIDGSIFGEMNPANLFQYYTEIVDPNDPLLYYISFSRSINDKTYILVFVSQSIDQNISIYQWLPYIDNIVELPIEIIYTDSITDYTVVSGHPFFIETKYIHDEELISFNGFNVIQSNKNYQDIIINSIEQKYQNFTQNFDTEYDILKENESSVNCLESRIVPDINKWVLRYKNIRQEDYKFNLSNVFGRLNFSPSHIDNNQNPWYYTHEWYYIAGLPSDIDDMNLKFSDSYISLPFIKEKLSDEKENYFEKYFNIEKQFVKDDYGNYRVVPVIRHNCFSIFHKENTSTYSTVFRGTKLILNSTLTDYSDYKFSAILVTRQTDRNVVENPFTIEIIENDTFKNITYVINVILDDYKIINNQGGISLDYLYLYVMNSLKQYNEYTQTYDYGIEFEYPVIPGIKFVDNDSDKNIVTKFRGYRLPVKTDFTNHLVEYSMTFDTYFKIFDFIFPINGKIGRLIGWDSQKATFITTQNSYIDSSTYAVRNQPTTISVLNNEILMENDGLSMIYIPGLFVYNSFPPQQVNTSIYDLSKVVWYHENSGQDIYKFIAKSISFANLFELTNFGNYTSINTNFESIKFIAPTTIAMTKSLSVTENRFDTKNNGATNIIDYNYDTVDLSYNLLRYSGHHKPKFNKNLWWQSLAIEKMFGNTGIPWGTCIFSWYDLNMDIVLNDDNVLSFNIPWCTKYDRLNVELKLDNILLDKLGFINNFYIHKQSSDDILSLDNPIYPSIGEIAVDKKNINIFQSNWDTSYYRHYVDKTRFINIDFDKIAYIEYKSFIGSKIFGIKKEIILGVGSSRVIENGMESNSINYHVVYGMVDNQYTFNVNGENIIKDWLIKEYFDEFSSYFKNITIRDFEKYVDLNLMKTISVDNVLVFIKHMGNDTSLFDFETDEIKLLNNGFIQNKSIKNTFIDRWSFNMKYTKKSDDFPCFNIRIKITS